MLIKTNKLTGPALDWAVTKCENFQLPYMTHSLYDWFRAHGPAYSTDWSQGGPIIEREEINLYKNKHPNWKANYPGQERYTHFLHESPLIAALRCYVASKLGEEVDVPEELV